MDKQTESREAFKKWWNEPEQAELRLSCAEGWGFRIWTASRESLVVELPETHAHLIWIQAGRGPDDYWDDVEISRSQEDRCCDGSERYEVYAKWQVEELLRAIGIRIKGEGV